MFFLENHWQNGCPDGDGNEVIKKTKPAAISGSNISQVSD